MFDLGWSELAVVAVVALVIIGPKDLPKVLRTVGLWVAKARAVARDFQSSVDEMAREADLQDVKKQIDELRSTNVADLIEKHVDPKGELREALEPPRELSHDPFGISSPDGYLPPADTAVPDTAAPDTVAPDTVAPGAAAAVDLATSAPTPSDMAHSDKVAPDTVVPDTVLPGTGEAEPPKPPPGVA